MLIVVLDPARHVRQDRSRIRCWVQRHVVALECVHERFGHVVGLRALDRRGQWDLGFPLFDGHFW